MIRAGHTFERGDGAGYVALRDIHHGDIIRAADLEPFGGAPVLKPGEKAPDWLVRAWMEL